MTREECQAKLLEYLYDLLDADERAEVERLLAQDADCQAALKLAEEQKLLLTAAAKTKFAEVRFEPPASRPATIPIARPSVRQFSFRLRWAVAAAVLLAVLAGGGYWYGLRPLNDAVASAEDHYASTRQKLEDAEKPLLQKRRELTQLVSRVKQESDDFTKKTADLTRSTQESYLFIHLLGPANIEAGADNSYQVAVRTLNDQPVDAKLTAKLLDAKQQPVCADGDLAFQKEEPGNYRLVLRPTLDLKNHSQVHLVVAARRENAPASELGVERPISVTKLVYITHVATDKPMYLPGESVYFRSLTLDRATLKPADEELRLHFAVTSPNGEEVFQLDGSSQLLDSRTNKPLLGPDKQPIRGVGAGVWTIDPNLKGGEYTLTVSEMLGKFPPEKRKFIVNRYEKPRMKKELEFTRKSYSAGDDVVAACKVSLAEGGQTIANRPVQATVTIDGKQYGADGKASDAAIRTQTDIAGAVAVNFKLPAEIDRGDASLAVQFTDGANVETIVRPIPIIVNKFYVQLFPEGGDLVAGAPNRVYFQARTTLDKPAELAGRLLEDGKEVASLETLHDDKEPGANQGMGVFAFTPVAGRKYELKIDRPAGIKAEYTFPEVKDDGVLLSIPRGVTNEKESIQVKVWSIKKDRSLVIGAYCRGRLIANKTVEAKAGTETAVELTPANGTGGVYRVTVFEQRGEQQFVPVAERLMYRTPADKLNLTLQTARAKYMPGEKAKLALEAADEKGQMTPAILMLAVVDKNLLTMADEKTHRVMPTHLFLTNEVRKPEDLEHTDFLLGNHPKAAVALDLLLGTQGWRRFAEQNVEEFRQNEKDEADRYLVAIGQAFMQASNYGKVAKAANVKLATEWETKRTEFVNKDFQIRQNLDKARVDYSKSIDAAGPSIAAATRELREAGQARRAASDNLAEYMHLWRIIGLAAAGGLLLAIGLGNLQRAVHRQGRQAAWHYRLATCCLIVIAVGVIWVSLGGLQPQGRESDGTVALLPLKTNDYTSLTDRLPERVEQLAQNDRAWKEGADGQVLRLLEEDAKQLGDLSAVGRGQFDGFGLGDGSGKGQGVGPRGGGGGGFAGGGADAGLGAYRGINGAARDGAGVLPPLAAPDVAAFAREQEKLAEQGAERAMLGALPAEAKGRGLRKAEDKNGALAQGADLARGEKERAKDLEARHRDEAKVVPVAPLGKEKQRDAMVIIDDPAKQPRKYFFEQDKKPEAPRQAGVEAANKPIPPGMMGAGPAARGGAMPHAGGFMPPAGGPGGPGMPGAGGGMAAGGRGGPGIPGMPGGGMGGMGPGGQGGPGMPGGGWGFRAPGGPGEPAGRRGNFGRGAPGAGGGKGEHFYLEGVEAMPQAPPPPPPPPCVVREYAHHRSLGTTDVRNDFTETLYWTPALVLDKGKAAVEFDLCDSLTTFQVLAYGHTLDGRIGAATFNFESRLPFSIEPKIPLEVTATDKIDLPVTIANDTDEPSRVTLGINVKGLNLEGKANQQLALDANKRVRRVFRLQPNIVDGFAEVQLEGRGGPLASDSINRRINVVPDGFPVVAAKSDVLEKVAVHDVALPESWIPGTLKLRVQVYPSALAELQQGLEGLLREPNGCFEQTSSSNYPNVLILNYLKENEKASPQVAARARDMIERGYQKLVSFECQNQAKKAREGYEWFGGVAPPHEALTAYGLLEFRDMAAVYPVDKAMVERTREYLMSCRDGRGGFNRNPRALDSFGRAPEDVTNAYIVWALTEGGSEDDLSKELMALKLKAKASDDPYFISLVANSLLNRNQADDGVGLLKKVGGKQKADGHLDAAATSITGSGGRDLQIETTALALLGWLKANRPSDFVQNIQTGIKWLGQQRGGHGSFGSTQSTILALKALIAFTKANKKTADSGELVLKAGDRELGRIKFAAGVQEPLTIDAQETLANKQALPLHAGKNSVRVEISGNNVLPYTLTWTYRTLKPLSADGCPVKLETKLDRTTAEEGETVRLNVKVQNVSGKGQGMAVAILGLPAGLTLPEDFKQLKDYTRLQDNDTKPGRISAWETQGRELVLYWRDLAPNAVIELPIDLICRVPGEYRGPASRAYLYYNADIKHWVLPLAVTIKAKAE